MLNNQKPIKHVLYVSSLCSLNVEEALLLYNPKLVGLQIQKYHRLLAKGFSENGVEVSSLSYHKGTHYLGLANGTIEIEDGIRYNYIVTNKSSYLSYFNLIFVSYKFAKKYFSQYPDASMICDILNFSVSFGAAIAARQFHRHVIGIITDFPEQLSEKTNLHSIMIWKLVKLCTEYVVLTEKMKERLAKRKKAIVLEGHVNYKIAINNKINFNEKISPRVCIYAGMLHRKYGIAKLVEAFIKADIDNAVLHIYGDGDYVDELKQINCNRVEYFGVVTNSVVVENERFATLLINPRPSDEEYAKYSFPSKNLEYMASGTPLLTTRLPGMPNEYEKYVYIFNDETIFGMAETLKNILTKPASELFQKGREAKTFVLREKSNIIQASKILSLLNN